MSRIALVCGPDAGHAFPVIAVGVELVARGHEVLLMTGGAWRDCRLPWVDLPFLEADPAETVGERLWVRPVRMTPHVVEVLRGWGPDLVVADTLTRVGWFAAGVLGLPWVEVLPHPLQDPSPSLPPVGHGLAAGTWWLPRRRDALLRRLSAPAVAVGRAERARALASLGLGETAPVLRLVATVPALEPARADWPAATHVVGALEWEPPAGAPVVPPGDGPLVVAASSTASGGQRDLFALTVDAVRGLRAGLGGPPVAARVAATALSVTARDVPPWAALSVGRQSALLEQADVVVCAAGGGITAKTLARGVPMVCVPGQGDQKDNAMRVHRLGAGVGLLPHRQSVPRLREALRAVLGSSSYATAARAVARGHEGLGPRRAGDLIEDVLSRR